MCRRTFRSPSSTCIALHLCRFGFPRSLWSRESQTPNRFRLPNQKPAPGQNEQEEPGPESWGGSLQRISRCETLTSAIAAMAEAGRVMKGPIGGDVGREGRGYELKEPKRADGFALITHASSKRFEEAG